jgi:hypothetical protein
MIPTSFHLIHGQVIAIYRKTPNRDPSTFYEKTSDFNQIYICKKDIRIKFVRGLKIRGFTVYSFYRISSS